MRFGMGIKNGVEWISGLKLIYRSKITFEFEAYLIGFGNAGLVRK